MSTTSSRNFTTLYSGSGSVVPQGAYGNANVVSLLATGTDGGNTVGNISATGNVTADYFIGNILGNITGNVTVTGSNTEVLFNSSGNIGAAPGLTFNSSSNVLATSGSITATGNVTGNYILGNGSQLTGLPATYGNANVVSLLAAFGSNTISSTGNITTTANVSGGYILGNGSQLTGLPASYSNANVAAFMAAFGSNAISTTGNVTAGYFIGDGSLLANINAGNIVGSYGNANVAAFMAAFGSNTISTTGNVTSGNVLVSSLVSVAGNIATNGTIFQNTFATAISAVGNITTATNVNAQTVSASGNITGSQFIGNGAPLTNITGANVTGTVANAAYATTSGSAATANTAVTVTGNAQANITSVGTLTSLSVSGNVDAGNLRTAGQVSATGNITGGNVLVPINRRYYGDFTTGTASGRTVFQTTATGTSSATNLTAVPGNNHVISNTAFSSGLNLFANGADVGNSAFGYVRQYGNRTEFGTLAAGTGTVGNLRFSAGSAQIYLQNSGNVGINAVDPQHGLAVNGNTLISGDLSVTGNISNVQIITATGNITTGNLVITPGTGAGNIDLVSSQAMTTVTTTNNPSRIIMGSGYTGNSDSWSVDYDPYSRMRQAGVLVNNRLARGDGAINTTGLVNIFQQEFTANITTGSTRNFSAINFLHVGGGSSAYQATITSPAAFVGMNSLVVAGTQGNVAVGNVTLTTATGAIFGVNPQNGASVGNAFGVLSTMQPGGATGNIINAVAFAPWTIATSGTPPTTVPTDYNVFYNPGSSAVYGSVNSQNWARSATNYYAFKNDDDVAQTKLGSLRSYHEYQYSTATSGTVNINKTNAQVQYIAPTANVTIGDFQNFVTTASNSVSSINQADTVTLIVKQGATPYIVTMPTGNASIKYAGNVTTVGSTANSVTMVSVTGANVAGAALYLVTISPEFV